jgi:hypothetical protein
MKERGGLACVPPHSFVRACACGCSGCAIEHHCAQIILDNYFIMPSVIDKHLDTINTAFTSLIPALAEASPNTRKSGETRLRQITARIPNLPAHPALYAPSGSAAPTPTANSTNNRSNRANSISISEKRSILVIKRAQKATSFIAKDPISPEELCTMLNCPFEGTHEDGEDAAFMRIFKGYESQSLDEWVSPPFLVSHIVASRCSFSPSARL